MSLFIESIKIEDGRCFNLPLHQERMNSTREAAFGKSPEISLEEVIKIPPGGRKGRVKCRVVYGEKIDTIEFVPYRLPSIHSLQIVYDDQLDYAFKYADRRRLEAAYRKRGGADDVLVIKNGCVTDTFFCNVVLRKGELYYTPDTFLLNGVRRQQLLREGKITERRIAAPDLKKFDSLCLINAMIGLEDRVCIAPANISSRPV